MNIKTVLWLMPFIGFTSGYLLSHRLFGDHTIAAPSVVGLPLDQAVHILSNAQLNPRILAHKQDPTLAENTIVSQSPAPGMNIKPHQSLFLVVSKKPAPVSAPNLVGSSQEHANYELQKLGIQAQWYEIPSAYPHKQCIAQFPKAGTPLDRKPMILYSASGNSKPYIWPDFSGYRINDVIEFLSMHPCNINVSHPVIVPDSHNCQDCLVVAQDPDAGSLIQLDERSPISVELHVQ